MSIQIVVFWTVTLSPCLLGDSMFYRNVSTQCYTPEGHNMNVAHTVTLNVGKLAGIA
jgi:hypothetical protein